MIALELASEQRAAVDAAFETCLAITGAPGTGKSATLRERIVRARERAPKPLVVDARKRLDELAVEILERSSVSVVLVDDTEAELLFEKVCAPLLALEWEELADDRIDPEVPSLRSPDRFAESAFRLIRKLRDAAIPPEEFLKASLSGATEFYAKPPNFADPRLLVATKDVYHDSLAVTQQELARQHRREVDLAKILAKLYSDYVDMVEADRRMTSRDAICEAIAQLQAQPALARELRERFVLAFVDDAQELTLGELALLSAIFGERLEGVTLCGDKGSAFSTFRGARPDAVFARAATTIELREQWRSPLAVELAIRRLTGDREAHGGATPAEALTLHRAQTPDKEAAFVADRIAGWIASGIAPERIAMIFRSVANVERYERALLDRDVCVAIEGDANVFTDRRALDALALLWNVYDPFRHDWLLRTLGNPAWGLSDASLAILCAEPPDPQRALFVFDGEPAPTARASRWDPKRDLRLGWNVARGDRDDALSPEARERVVRFRQLREGWVAAMHELPFTDFARLVWSEGLAREGTAGSARARAQSLVLDRLLARFAQYGKDEPNAGPAEHLAYAASRANSALESCETLERDEDFVRIASIDAVRGREFDCVAIAGVKAGSFPRWYVPDAFLYSPRLGMVPKDNAGDARASRTAKFSYYMYRTKARESYNEQDRCALVYALRRARRFALVTASGTPTRGVAAPEFFEELRSARLPGVAIA